MRSLRLAAALQGNQEPDGKALCRWPVAKSWLSGLEPLLREGLSLSIGGPQRAYRKGGEALPATPIQRLKRLRKPILGHLGADLWFGDVGRQSAGEGTGHPGPEKVR
jgi:hypothetical protein